MQKRTVVWLSLAAALVTGARAEAACPPEVFTTSRHAYGTIDNPGAPLATYFALITVDTAKQIGLGNMRTDGGDVRFTDSGCNAVPYYIQDGLNTATTHVWLKLSAVPTGPSNFTMHFGNGSLTHTNQADDVFGTGVVALYTFTEGSGDTVHDWVGGKNLTLSGPSWTTGPRADLGAVMDFGLGRLAREGDSGPALGTGSFSTFASIYSVSPNGSTQGIIGNYDNDGVNGWVLKEQGGSGQMMLLVNEGGNWCQGSLGTIAPNTWTIVGAKRDAGVGITLYQDGNSVGTNCGGDARNVDNSGPWEIGRSYNGSYAFDGSISFSAVYNTAVSDAFAAELHAGLFPGMAPTTTIDINAGRRPGAPTITSATADDGQITINFDPPADDGGSAIIDYTVTCTGGITATSMTGPITLMSLTNGMVYVCRVQARNALASSLPSDPVQLAPGIAPGVSSAAYVRLTVGQAANFQVVSSGNPAPTITFTGSPPSGVTFANGLLSGTPDAGTVGIYTLDVTIDNGVGTPAHQTLTIEVAKIAQTISFDPIADTSITAGTVNAVVTADSGLTPALQSVTTSVCTISGTTITLVAPGECVIVADQAGDADHAAAATTGQHFMVNAINRVAQTISFDTIADTAISASTVMINVSASSGLAVTVTSLSPQTCTLTGSTVSLVAVGTCVLQATQDGDANTLPAPSVTRSFAVNAVAIDSQTITFEAISDTALTAGTVTLTASASSGLAVTIDSLTTGVCTVSGTTATLVSVGTCVLQASQAGDATHSAAAPVTRSFAITTTGPAAPTIDGIDPVAGGASVRFTPASSANTCNSGPLYTVSCSPGPVEITGSTSPLVVHGLAAATDYSCVVRVTTCRGTSADSAPMTFHTEGTAMMAEVGCQMSGRTSTSPMALLLVAGALIAVARRRRLRRG